LIRFLKILPDPEAWKFWVILALFIKVGFSCCCISEFHNKTEIYHGALFLTSGDSSSYFDPIDHFILNGVYEDDFRMPGYGWLYYLLRLVFSSTASLNCLGFLQLLLSATSVFILGKLCRNLFKCDRAFYLGYFIYLISTFTSIFDSFLLTESFCTSAAIFSLYLLSKEETSGFDLLFSGFFITWCIFLRPIFAPVILLQVLFLFFNRKGNSFQFITKNMICFLLLFLLVEGTWIYRNNIKYHRLIPLTKCVFYPDNYKTYEYNMISFCRAFGGWEAGVHLNFNIPDSKVEREENELSVPSTIYTSAFNLDSLIILKNKIEKMNEPGVTVSEKMEINKFLTEKFFLYTNSIRRDKPFVYYISSRLRAFKYFFLNSGTINLFYKPFHELNLIQKVIKLFYSTVYYFVLIFGFAGFLMLFVKGRKTKRYLFILVAFTGLYLVLACPLILKFDERRFLVPAYPLLVIGVVKVQDSISPFFFKVFA
jgi:hypothetical protein